MLTNLYLFIFPLTVAILYVLFKVVVNREAIKNMELGSLAALPEYNNLEEAKEKIFLFFDGLRESFLKSAVIFLHWLLHFFVLFLKFISNITEALYAKARDFFLKTATKEKGAVSVFWHHLKEYKKEKELEEDK